MLLTTVSTAECQNPEYKNLNNAHRENLDIQGLAHVMTRLMPKRSYVRFAIVCLFSGVVYYCCKLLYLIMCNYFNQSDQDKTLMDCIYGAI